MVPPGRALTPDTAGMWHRSPDPVAQGVGPLPLTGGDVFVIAVYSRMERQVDAVVHAVGLAFAVSGATWLGLHLPDLPSWRQSLCLGLYGLALVGVLGISAAYNLSSGPVKEILRRLDHAMIFLMIAATYTPFITLRLPSATAIPLGSVVWTGCAVGCAIKLLLPRRFERLSVGLYLAMGWAVAWALRPLSVSLKTASLTLLVVGGALYTVGVLFCLMERLRFHNALWHAFVLAGAATHFATVAVEFSL